MVCLLCGPWFEWHYSKMAVFMFYIWWGPLDNICYAICYLYKHIQSVHIQAIPGHGTRSVYPQPVTGDPHHTVRHCIVSGR